MKKVNKTKKSSRTTLWRNAISVVLVGLFCVIVAKNWQQMKAGFTVLESVSIWWILFGFVLYACTQLFGATSYFSLAIKKVSWRELYIVEWASAGINRLLPAGAGSMGIHGLYLLKRKHSVAESVAVVGINNVLSIVSHLILLSLVLLLSSNQFIDQNIELPTTAIYYVLIVVFLFIVLLGFSKIRRVVSTFFKDLLSTLKTYKSRPTALIKSVVAVLGITFTNTILLLSMMHAVGLQIDLIAAFLIVSIGTAFGALFPTPGGLGGVEAGLVGALILFDAPSASAIAVAILFRFVTFWMPLVVGNVVFLAVRNKNYF